MARVLLGVSGGIAAYKAVEIARLLTRGGHAVRVVQTRASLEFVGRATFAAITGAPVLVDEFEQDPARGAYPGDPAPGHAPISHLELIRRCDVLCVAPASANTIAKLANGLADNLLTSAALAADCPLVVAPAMNDRMYEHPATRANLEALAARGAQIVPPGVGELASRGEWGAGRLAEPAEIVAQIDVALAPAYAPRSLDGMRVLVTAGGTREPIDAVRYVGNRSSGRMGLSLAEAAARRGAQVTVVAANVSLPRADGVRYIDVETAAELESATLRAAADAEVILMTAAVADFRPSAPDRAKIAKAGRERLRLELERTPDVLAALVAGRREGQTIVGFAAEHGEGAVARAQEKLAGKRLDAIVVNDVSIPGIGFDSAENEVTFVAPGIERKLARGSKPEVARAILDAVAELRAGGLPAAVEERA